MPHLDIFSSTWHTSFSSAHGVYEHIKGGHARPQVLPPLLAELRNEKLQALVLPLVLNIIPSQGAQDFMDWTLPALQPIATSAKARSTAGPPAHRRPLPCHFCVCKRPGATADSRTVAVPCAFRGCHVPALQLAVALHGHAAPLPHRSSITRL